MLYTVSKDSPLELGGGMKRSKNCYCGLPSCNCRCAKNNCLKNCRCMKCRRSSRRRVSSKRGIVKMGGGIGGLNLKLNGGRRRGRPCKSTRKIKSSTRKKRKTLKMIN